MVRTFKGYRSADTRRVAVMFILVGALLAAPFLFFQSRVGAAACVAPTTDYGRVTTSANVPSAATYRVWTRMQVPNTTDNTYLLELDGNKCYTVGGAGIGANTWTWVSFQNGNQSSRVDVSLTAGAHSMKLIGNKPGVKVDRVVFLSDLNCVPTGMGDNCNVPNDTTAPSTRLSAPADASTVSGASVGLSATATDASGVSRTEFYADGVHISSDTTAPYSATWDSTKVTNGTHSLTVRGYDITGNMSSSTVSVTVKNGDTEAPATPLNVSAIAPTATAVQLKWSASADNTGVIGYNVFRDGAPVAKVGGSTTQYEDAGVASQTTYAYQVQAFDQAGNLSSLSARVAVVTPAVVDTRPPTQPQELVAATVSPSQVNLSWSKSTDNVAVAAYDIYRASNGRTPGKIATIGTSTYGDTGLSEGTSYTYYVIARDAAGNVSAKSAAVSATTGTTNPDTWRISGHVSTPKGMPISGARISSFARDGTRHTTQTNLAGWYAIRDLENGVYGLTAYKEGFESSAKTVIIKDASALKQTITLQRR